jgi:hypothetical protein
MEFFSLFSRMLSTIEMLMVTCLHEHSATKESAFKEEEEASQLGDETWHAKTWQNMICQILWLGGLVSSVISIRARRVSITSTLAAQHTLTRGTGCTSQSPTSIMATAKINYTAFADFLNNYQDAFAVKRFRELQIRNLLFYQAELAHLREELEEIEQKDTETPSKHVTSRWTPEMAKEPASGSNPMLSSTYSKKMLQIRSTLTSYSESADSSHSTHM